MYTRIYLLLLKETFLFLHTFNICNNFLAPKGKGWGNSWRLDVPPEWDFSSDHRQSCLGLDLAPRGLAGQCWHQMRSWKCLGSHRLCWVRTLPSLGNPC